MQRADATRLEAILGEVEDLANKARRCTQHTFYKSTNPDAMKKYKRTDEDVARWLGELEVAVDRLKAHRVSVPEIAI